MLFGRNKSWKTDPVKLTFNFLRFTTITTECTGVVTCRAKSPEQLRGAVLASECFCGVLRAERLVFSPGSAAEILALVAFQIMQLVIFHLHYSTSFFFFFYFDVFRLITSLSGYNNSYIDYYVASIVTLYFLKTFSHFQSYSFYTFLQFSHSLYSSVILLHSLCMQPWKPSQKACVLQIVV